MEWQLSIIVVLCTRVGIDISQNIQEQLKPLFCHMLLDHNMRKVAAEPVIMSGASAYFSAIALEGRLK